MSARTHQPNVRNDQPTDPGFSRLGYDENGTLCVLDVTFRDGTRRVINGHKRNSAPENPETSGDLATPDLNTAAFPSATSNFSRLGYEGSVMVVLETGDYRRPVKRG